MNLSVLKTSSSIIDKVRLLVVYASKADDFTLDPDSKRYSFDVSEIDIQNKTLKNYSKTKNYDAICFVTSSISTIENEEKWTFLTQRFPTSIILLWNDDTQDLTPKCGGAPFLKIKKNNLNTPKVQTLLNAIQEFKIVNTNFHLLQKEIHTTNQIADLNIERLYKTLKELEVARDKAKANELEKQSFLASVTHELRTPLNAILGFSGLFDTANLNPEQAVNISAIKKASSNLLDIVNDVLNLSKLNEGKLSIFKEAFNLCEEIENAFNLLKNKATEKNLSYTLTVNFDTDRIVFGDKLRLNQVLVNLLNNAIKFTKEGKVNLTVSNPLDDVVIFTISDSGIGINKEKIDFIFEGYSQAENFTSHEFGGTGLGLSIVKQLIELQDGKIEVKSKVNIGSTFSFQLNFPEISPLTPRNKSDKKIDRPPKTLNLNVLVVEDNQLNQLLINRILSNNVLNLTVCGDGESALKEAKKAKYDAILVDLHLPKINGIETINAIKETEQNKNTAVAIITASIWEEELNKIEKAGINTIIHKPYTPNKLLSTLEKMVIEQKLNLSYIDNISNGDEAFKINIFKAFIKNNKIDLNRLIKALETNNYSMLAEIAHKMKASLSMLGFEELSQLCQNIESNPNNFDQKKLKLFSKKCKEAREYISILL